MKTPASKNNTPRETGAEKPAPTKAKPAKLALTTLMTEIAFGRKPTSVILRASAFAHFVSREANGRLVMRTS
jgi:hypothetical protein